MNALTVSDPSISLDSPRVVRNENDKSSLSSRKSLEIETGHEEEDDDELSGIFGDGPDLYANERNDDDLDALLGVVSPPGEFRPARQSTPRVGKNPSRGCCCGTVPSREEIRRRPPGAMRIPFPRLYQWTRGRLGIMGPDFWGPLGTLFLLLPICLYYIGKASRLDDGHISASCSKFLTTISVISLFFVTCANPGIVSPNRRQERTAIKSGASSGSRNENENGRWCDLCNVLQARDTHHCSECMVCINGHDHHCPWMGMCIGRDNMTAFIIFNTSWLIHLIFALGWIAAAGPVIVGTIPK
eukprot:CAMPEP_0198281702 /NCGR_PEP_ID=MMETSP1449-20131203/1604_1 /TAXON_ID=420275 /ORGANISM="Attheya septentrionalis, Strain CCMP2084" /LENGTH=299 /DNA_ID=CAMNT_0043977599 /DNA_START=272 /DNA_END=1171 /DNA_ORIENTATION=-